MRNVFWLPVFCMMVSLPAAMAGALVPGQVDPLKPGFREGNVNPLGVVLAWSSDANATSYRVQFTESPDGSHNFSNPLVNAVVTDTTLALHDLNFGDVYIWRVRGIDADGEGPWSIVTGFITARGGPLQVQLISPFEEEQDVAVNPAELTWAPVEGATSYALDISTVRDFSTAVVSRSGLQDTRFVTNELDRDVLYYWRVKANNSARVNWSLTQQFYTGRLIPKEANLVAPPDGAIQQPAEINFQWAPLSGVFTYTLQLARDSAFTNVALTQEGITETAYKVEGLTFETMYYWRVRGVNDKGIGAWSEAWRLTTVVPPPAQVALVSPADEAQDLDLDVDLVWQAVPGIAMYNLEVARDTAFTERAITATGLVDTTAQATNLEDNTRYYWRVRGENGAGLGPWSEVRAFQTALQPPGVAVALVEPSNGAVDVTFPIALRWATLAEATTYWVQVARDRRFTNIVQEQAGLADTTLTAVVDPAQPYYWRVRGENAAGAGPWSVVWQFTSITTVDVETETVPEVFALAVNYPNPFSTTTHIMWSLPDVQDVRLTIYDVHGRIVDVLLAKRLGAGRYEVNWGPPALPNGLYFYRLEAGPYSGVRRMIRVK